MTIGERLRILRNERNLKQEEIAKELVISRVTYTNIENNNRQSSLKLLIKISDFYRLSLDYIVFGAKKNKNEDPNKVRIINNLSFNNSGYLNNVIDNKPFEIDDESPDDYFIFRIDNIKYTGNRIKIGDEILFKETSELKYDHLLLAVVNKKTCILGKLFLCDDITVLIPENRSRYPYAFNKNNIDCLEIIGIKIRIIMNLD